jgi:hypothetical protein
VAQRLDAAITTIRAIVETPDQAQETSA